MGLYQRRDIKLNWQNGSCSSPTLQSGYLNCIFMKVFVHIATGEKNLIKETIFVYLCAFVRRYFVVCVLCFLRSAHELFALFFCLALTISWMLQGVEKLLDYGRYYRGLKYVGLYVGALSPCPIRIV